MSSPRAPSQTFVPPHPKLSYRTGSIISSPPGLNEFDLDHINLAQVAHHQLALRSPASRFHTVGVDAGLRRRDKREQLKIGHDPRRIHSEHSIATLSQNQPTSSEREARSRSSSPEHPYPLRQSYSQPSSPANTVDTALQSSSSHLLCTKHRKALDKQKASPPLYPNAAQSTLRLKTLTRVATCKPSSGADSHLDSNLGYKSSSTEGRYKNNHSSRRSSSISSRSSSSSSESSYASSNAMSSRSRRNRSTHLSTHRRDHSRPRITRRRPSVSSSSRSCSASSCSLRLSKSHRARRVTSSSRRSVASQRSRPSSSQCDASRSDTRPLSLESYKASSRPSSRAASPEPGNRNENSAPNQPTLPGTAYLPDGTVATYVTQPNGTRLLIVPGQAGTWTQPGLHRRSAPYGQATAHSHIHTPMHSPLVFTSGRQAAAAAVEHALALKRDVRAQSMQLIHRPFLPAYTPQPYDTTSNLGLPRNQSGFF